MICVYLYLDFEFVYVFLMVEFDLYLDLFVREFGKCGFKFVSFFKDNIGRK